MKKYLLVSIFLFSISPAHAQTLGTSAAAPAPASSFSSTTGLFSSASGAVSVTSGGTEIMRVNGTGVGIDTTSPDYPLSVQSLGDASITLKNSGGTTKAYFGTAGIFGTGSTDDLRIRSDGSDILFGFSGFEKMRITSSGYVGVGTTTPAALLDVGNPGSSLGTLRMEGSTSGYVQLQPAAAAGSWTMTLPSNAGTSGYVLQTNGSGVTSWTVQAGASIISSNGQLLCGGSLPPCHSSTLSYCPYKGNQKTTANYGTYTIPSGTAASGCLTANLASMYIGGTTPHAAAANTLYYVYLINVSGTTYLDLETTGHATDSTTGVEIMSGNNTRTLVGMIRTDSGSKVSTQGTTTVAGDTNTVATWDNRVATSTRCEFTTPRSQTSNVGYSEINSENRCYFMSWGDGAVYTGNMLGANNTVGSDCLTAISLDATGTVSAFLGGTAVVENTANSQMILFTSASSAPAEGYHFTALYGTETNGSTCTWLGGSGEYIYVSSVQ